MKFAINTLVLFITIVWFSGILRAQAQDNWPEPSVALYDCDISGASGTDSSQHATLGTASKLIFQDILSDTTTREVFLISYGFADTTATDLSSAAGFFLLPDTAVGTDYDYVIGSEITGSSGSYSLTVSIEDGRSFAHVADGNALIGAASIDNVKAACSSAIAQILPLVTSIRTYQERLKAANPLLTINPQIVVSPAALKLSLNGSTDVSITATDCDGAAITNRTLNVVASLGTVSPSSVQTDGGGNASFTYTAGSSQGIAIITVTLQNPMPVTSDTTNPSGSASIVTGDIDTTGLWVLEFDLHRSGSGYKDETTQDVDGSGWTQKISFWVQSAHGKYISKSNGSQNTEFAFNDTALSVSGTLFMHDFTKYTYSDFTGQNCPKNSWEMSGTSQSYATETDSDNHGSADFSYSKDPQGFFAFDLMLSHAMVDYYAYDWTIEGNWDNGTCKTSQNNQNSHSKPKLTFPGGITYYGIGSVPGLTIIPSYTGTTITGYTIIVNNTTASYYSDGSFVVSIDKCTATLKQFSSVTGVKPIEAPKAFFLAQSYPNPFNPSTIISYQLPVNDLVTLEIYDVLGREVKTLVNERQTAGSHLATFNAANLPSGVYFYRLQAGSFTATKKLLLLK